MKTRYYIGVNFKQFNNLMPWLRRHKIPCISNARTANQSEYTVLLSLTKEDLLAIQLGIETNWIRKSNW